MMKIEIKNIFYYLNMFSPCNVQRIYETQGQINSKILDVLHSVNREGSYQGDVLKAPFYRGLECIERHGVELEGTVRYGGIEIAAQCACVCLYVYVCLQIEGKLKLTVTEDDKVTISVSRYGFKVLDTSGQVL